ncbi:MAG TPA: GAF domain-containing protein [Burkholderiaceae bacterium]|nr:GAF domain-containing protein [Burkholderiaceae bacterium]
MIEQELLQEISGSLERGEIDGGRYLEQFTRLLATQIGCTRATVRVFIDTPDGRALRSIAMYDASQDRMVATEDLLRADSGPYFERLLHDGCVVASDAQADPIVAPFLANYLGPNGIRSVMDMCFAVNGELFGTFSCEQLNVPIEWTQRQVQMLRKLASRASLTLMHVVNVTVDTAPGALWETSTPNRLATMPIPLDPTPNSTS